IETFSGVTVNGAGNEVGGLFGQVYFIPTFTPLSGTATLINNASVNDTLNGAFEVGGIMGVYNTSANTSYNMTNNGSVNVSGTGAAQVGGIVGGLVAASTWTGALINNGTLTTPVSTDVGSYVGDLAGGILNSTVLTTNAQTIDGYDNSIGGIVGRIDSGFLEGSGGYSNTGNIGTNATSAGTRNIGGIVGYMDGGTLTASMTNSGNVGNSGTNTTYVGGLIGHMAGGSITGTNNFYTTGGSVIGTTQVGGLIGGLGLIAGLPGTATFTLADPISGPQVNISSAGSVTGSGNYVGGIVGQVLTGGSFTPTGGNATGTLINNASVTENASGSNYIGGIFGVYSDTNVVSNTNAYNLVNASTGTISATIPTSVGFIGGIVGEFRAGTFTGTISNSAAIATPHGAEVGGIAGRLIGGVINNSTLITNTQNIDGDGTNTTLGGIVGWIQSGGLEGSGGYENTGNIGTASSSASNASVGGIVGFMGGGTITAALTNSGNNTIGNISNIEDAGGIIGGMNGGTINGTLLNDVGTTIKGGRYVGGIFGHFGYEGSQVNVSSGSMSNDGSVSGSTSGNVGGIVGRLDSYGGFTTTLAGPKTIGDGAHALTLSLSNGGVGLGGIVGEVLLDGTALGSVVISGTSTINSHVTYSADSTTTDIGGIIGEIVNSGSSTFLLSGTMTNQSLINVSGSNVGGFIGELNDSNTADTFTSNFSNAVNVTGGSTVGGVIGLFTSGDVTGSLSNSAAIQGTQKVGGIIGLLNGGMINNSSLITNTGDISGSNSIGGIVGDMSSGSLNGTGGYENTGNIDISGVAGVNSIGGIIGYFTGGTLTGSGPVTNAGNVGNNTTPANTAEVGGLIGNLQGGTISTSGLFETTAGTIAGSLNVGGLIGLVNTGSSFTPTGTSTISTSSGVIVNGSNNCIGGLFGDVFAASAFTPPPIFPDTTVTLTNNAHVNAVGSLFSFDIGGIFGGFLQTGLTVSAALVNHGPISVTAGTNSNMGGIAGAIQGSNFTGGMTSNGTVISTVVTTNVGGLIGTMTAGSMTGTGTNFNTTSGAVVRGGSAVGGLVGNVIGTASFQVSGDTNIYSTGTVTGSGSFVGGLIGSVNTSGSFTPATSGTLTNNASVTDNASGLYVGGLFGSFIDTNAISNINAYNLVNASTGAISATAAGIVDVGGIAGEFSAGTFTGTITNAATISAPSATNIGGIIGIIDSTSGSSGGVINNSTLITNAQNIDGDSLNNTMGGIVGRMEVGSLQGSGGYRNTGNIGTAAVLSTNSVAGGIVGYMIGGTITASLTNSGNVGNVANIVEAGGIIGALNEGTINGTLINSAGTTISGGRANRYVGGIFGHFGAPVGQTADASVNVTSGSMSNYGSVISAGTGAGAGGIVGSLRSSNGYTTTLAGPKTVGNGTNMTLSLSNGGVGLGGIVGVVQLDGTALGSIVISDTSTINSHVTYSADSTTTDIGGIIGQVLNSGSSTFSLSGAMTNQSLINVSGANVGGFIGELNDSNTADTFASNFSNTVSVTGSGNVGGLIGTLSNGTLSGTLSVTSPTLTLNAGGTGLGGFVGHMLGSSNIASTNATLSSSTVFDAASAFGIGAVVGVLENNATLSGVNSFTLPTTFTVANATDVGGLIGEMNNASFTQMIQAHINVNAGTSNSVGGVVGSASNSIIASTNPGPGNISSLSYSGTVSGNDNVGGVIGSLTNHSTLSQAFLAGTVIGNMNVGGIVGVVDATSVLDTSYNMHTVIGNAGAMNVGGMVGDNSGTLSNLIFGGVVQALSGGTNVGGLVGLNTGTVLSSMSAGALNIAGVINKGAIAGDNAGNLGLNNTTTLAPFYSGTTFAPGIGAVGTGTVGGSQADFFDAMRFEQTFLPYSWNFSSTWQQLSGYLVVLQWCGANCGIPAPVVATNNYAKEYVTVNQILNDADLTDMQQDYLTYGDTFSIYNVSMIGYALPFQVYLFAGDPTAPNNVVFKAMKVLAAANQHRRYARVQEVMPMKE
ncbi:MAG: beta strand repeat-containing protein, partial [Gammaproteobacteria bacterium]